MSKRQKTNLHFNVRLLNTPIQILEKYKGTQLDGKILPVISNQKVNEYLKEIADLCSITKNLTFHMSRHLKKTKEAVFLLRQPLFNIEICYAPKSSNIKFSRGTPKSQSIFSTALAIGPGPHI